MRVYVIVAYDKDLNDHWVSEVWSTYTQAKAAVALKRSKLPKITDISYQIGVFELDGLEG